LARACGRLRLAHEVSRRYARELTASISAFWPIVKRVDPKFDVFAIQSISGRRHSEVSASLGFECAGNGTGVQSSTPDVH